MTSRLLKFPGIVSLALIATLSSGLAVGAKTPPKPKAKPEAKANTKAKPCKPNKKNSKPCPAQGNASATQGYAIATQGNASAKAPLALFTMITGFAVGATTDFKPKPKDCPPPRGNPSPGTPLTNPPCR